MVDPAIAVRSGHLVAHEYDLNPGHREVGASFPQYVNDPVGEGAGQDPREMGNVWPPPACSTLELDRKTEEMCPAEESAPDEIGFPQKKSTLKPTWRMQEAEDPKHGPACREGNRQHPRLLPTALLHLPFWLLNPALSAPK